MFVDGLENLLGNGEHVAALQAGNAGLTLLLDAASEIFEFFEQGVLFGGVVTLHLEQIFEQMILQGRGRMGRCRRDRIRAVRVL